MKFLFLIFLFSITANAQSVSDVLLSEFENAEIVILGETHRIKHEVEFVKQLVFKLPMKNVNSIGFELLDFRLQTIIDSLIKAPEFDKALAKEIIFNSKPDWVYLESIDLLYEIWKTNKSYPNFRLIALGYKLDYQKIDPEYLGDKDSIMAQNVKKNLIGGDKILIVVGSNHAFTKFQQTTIGGAKLTRLGNFLNGNFGYNVSSINMSFLFKKCNFKYCLNPLIDLIDTFPKFISAREVLIRDIAIDSLVIAGCRTIELKKLYDGYIVFNPMDSLQLVRLDKEFYKTKKEMLTHFFEEEINPENKLEDYFNKHIMQEKKLYTIIQNSEYCIVSKP